MSDDGTNRDGVAEDSRLSSRSMGPLELGVYKNDWLTSRIYHRHVAELATRRELKAAAQAAQDQIMKAAGMKPERAADASRKPSRRGLSPLRESVDIDDKDRDERDIDAPTPGRVAARLLLARLFDRFPAMMRMLRTSAPVLLVDVADRGLLARIAHQWKDALGLEDMRFADLAKLPDRARREDFDAIIAVFPEVLTATDRPVADARAFSAVQLALPILAFTLSAESHLSKVLLDAASFREYLPPVDASLIVEVIRIVTGKACREPIQDHVAKHIGLHELLLSVRFDRTPTQCIEQLVQLAKTKISKKGSRELSLDELHGMDEAVAWAKSVIVDIEAWRRGEIAWDAIDAGIVLDGPPGVGKTLFCKVFADETRLPLITATLAQWQSSGEAHLGHLLRAMRKDFQEARAKSPAILFVDELDSFPNRSNLTHSHRDYVIEVVNAFIEQLDGVQGRQGLIFVGATNDVGRCDPAIVRSGRLNRVIKVGLPEPAAIVEMMRVRLRGDLASESLSEISLLAIGSSGADVERIVKDARRFARQEERALSLSDLRRAVLGSDEAVSPEQLLRASVHEAGHIIIGVIHNGPEDIHAIVAGARDNAGFVASRRADFKAGTAEEYRRTLQELLAGRAAEEVELGSAGNGAGGSQRSDLAKATSVAAAMVGSVGHGGPHPLLFIADHFETNTILDHAYLRAAAHQELSAAFEEAKRLLGLHRQALKQVAGVLQVRGRIDGAEVAEAIATAAARDTQQTFHD
jgi:ATP-dependent Zn protease